MTWDSVPWFVGGGAQHSPEIARLLAYAATSAAEGIVSPGDLKVVPLDVPGAKVRALAGAALILNRFAGGAQQTYVARNPSEDVVDIPTTGSGSGRSDLIIARIEDPFVAGSPFSNPSDVTVGPYVRTYRVPNVAPGTTTPPVGTTGIALARIDLPANTTQITTSMIKDVRKLAQPRSGNDYEIQGIVGTQPVLLAETNWKLWPSNARMVAVPSWATHAQVSITLQGILSLGPGDVNLRVNFGGLTGPISYFDTNDLSNGAGWEVTPATAYVDLDVRSLAGRTVQANMEARRSFPENNGQVIIDDHHQWIIDVRFAERVV